MICQVILQIFGCRYLRCKTIKKMKNRCNDHDDCIFLVESNVLLTELNRNIL